MSQSPLQTQGSKDYADAWRAINILIRSDGTWSGRERNLCFRNRGDGTFDDFSFLTGLDLASDGRAFVPLDLDGDGDQDLILKNRNGRQLRAFRNDMPPSPTKSLTVRLRGTSSNRDGVGGRVWVNTDRRTLMRDIVSGSGYLSQRSRVANFGLREDETVHSVRVRWPLGEVQSLEQPPQQGSIVLVEGKGGFRDDSLPEVTVVASEPARSDRRVTGSGTWLAEPLPAPSFSLRGITGGADKVSLSDQLGSPILLNFWATWCPPCRSELTLFQSQIGELRAADINVLSVSVDEPSQSAAVSTLATELGLTFAVLLADSETAEAYSVLNERLFDRRRALAIPTSFLLNREGQIVKVYRGEVEPDQVLDDVKVGTGDAEPFEGRWIVSQPSRDFQELASAFAERGLATSARMMFGEALARGNRSPLLLNNLAGALIAEGATERAEALLREALAAAPGLTDAKVNLASLLLGREAVSQAAISEAESLLERAVDEQPLDGQALSALGSIRFSQGNLDVAEELFRRAAAALPEDPRPRENVGAALASQGKIADALREYEEAQRLGGDTAHFYTNLGMLYMQSGYPGKGLEAFLNAAKADPDSPGPQLNLARYRLQTGEASEALQRIQRAKQLAPDNLEAALMEVQALAMLGRTDAARRAAQEVLRRHPGSAEAKQLIDLLE